MRSLFLSSDRAILHDGTRLFEPQKFVWRQTDTDLVNAETVSLRDAVRWLYTETNGPRVPVGVIGPRNATPRQVVIAEALGQQIAALSLPLMNGGKGGVMEAVSKGCRESGGCVIGLLPEGDWSEANPHVTIPIATGIGKARNVLIAQSCVALIAVGGELGTLSEMAFGRHFDKPVFALDDAPVVEGVQRLDSVEAVIDALAGVILNFSET